MIRKIICWLKAIPFYLRTGLWVQHCYEDTYEKAIIVCTDTKFKASDNFFHTSGERIYPKACLIRSRCIYCGHKDVSWYKDYDEYMAIVNK